jgi:CheY-like chemotaxis protein
MQERMYQLFIRDELHLVAISANTLQLVDLMHGEITLDSVLGTGTKATFSIPFNKAQFHGGSSPLVDLGSIPDRLQSETSVSGCGSDPERISSTPPHSPRELPISNRHHKRIPSNEAHPTRPGLGQASREYDQVLHESERGQVHILVVEDNAINQQIALKTIKKLGFSVSAVWNGREALDYLLEPPTPEHPRPSVILMDVQMPILDGYRATHLIRHHRPYSSLPGMRAIPIVAMTASAIQGDREKCERAGMDDYLAKPVKGKTLEKMLIKWALRGKRHGFYNTSYHSIHTEHDSNCTESEAASPPKAVYHLRFDPSSEDNLRNRAIAEGSRLPSEETEDELGLRSVAAEEKATALRNDKLLNTANEEHMLRYHVPSVPRPGDRAPSLPTAALTAENLAQNSVAAAAQGPPRALHASALPGFGHKGGVLSHSSMAVEGRATSGSSTVGGSGSTVGSLKSMKKTKGNSRRRMEMMRNDSEMSQRTVTQQSSMETESEETGSEDVELGSTIESRSGEE